MAPSQILVTISSKGSYNISQCEHDLSHGQNIKFIKLVVWVEFILGLSIPFKYLHAYNADVVGDLTLAGAPILGHKSGHALNQKIGS
jgi:hypothetical protein